MTRKRLIRGCICTLLLTVCYICLIFPLSNLSVGNFAAGGFFSVRPVVHEDNGVFTVSHNISGLFDIKSPALKSAYIGGFPVAMALYTDGVILDEVAPVETSFGRTTPASALNRGDFLTEINGEKITKSSDIDEVLAKNGDAKATVTVLRNNEKKHIQLQPAKEEFSNKYRLGLVVRDYILGIGMVTYVEHDGSFGALGHPISDSAAGRVPIRGGQVFKCEEIGVTKGEKGKPGELRVKINSIVSPIGQIYRNSGDGVYGKFDNMNFTEKAGCGIKKLYPVAPRKKAAMGSAHILTTINGVTDLYKIEIVKVVGQSSFSDKGLVLRVTDKRLLEKTGGIVQGMSGSPIVQNGMIVGAVTHVFINDPTKGYGIYMDWMLDD